jgi:hypothetical protein
MIDELEELQRFRSMVLPPTARVWVVAEEQLQEAIAAEEVLLAAGGVLNPPSPDLKEDNLPQDRQQLTPTAYGRRHLATSRNAWRVALVLLVVAGVTTAAVVASRQPNPSKTSAAAVVLAHFADIARAQPSTIPLQSGQYLYDSSTQTNPVTKVLGVGTDDSFTVLQPETRQIWRASDGAGRLVESYGTPTFLSPHDQQVWVRLGSPAMTRPTLAQSFPPGGLHEPDLAQLSTNPAILAGEIGKADGGSSAPGERFAQIGDLLRETDASPALRAALLQVAAALPGVDLLGRVTDHAGGTGEGFAYTNNGVAEELILDLTTSALIGEQQSAAIDNPPGFRVVAGTVIGWALYSPMAVVGSPTTLPTT